MESAPVLDSYTRDSAITLLGNGRGLDTLFRTLHAREPIVLGVFGASVAQNAGCLDQPHKRCIWYSGRRNITVGFGTPKRRPFKGFAVRLFDHINAQFPHKDHQINNSALDATPAQAALPCLFSHLPSRLHLVVLDFGSMATHLDLTAVEGVVRALLSLKPPPALLLLSVQEWCTQRITPRGAALPRHPSLSRISVHTHHDPMPWSQHCIALGSCSLARAHGTTSIPTRPGLVPKRRRAVYASGTAKPASRCTAPSHRTSTRSGQGSTCSTLSGKTASTR